MKFFDKPNLLVRVANPKRGQPRYIKFNEKGEVEVTDESLIKRMKIKFKYEEVKEKQESIDLNTLKRQELFELCKEKGIKEYATKKNEEIIELLRGE